MCTVLLPPGVNPIAVNKYISYHIKYILLLSYSVGSIFYQYMFVFLFITVIYVFLLLGVCILIVRLP